MLRQQLVVKALCSLVLFLHCCCVIVCYSNLGKPLSSAHSRYSLYSSNGDISTSSRRTSAGRTTPKISSSPPPVAPSTIDSSAAFFYSKKDFKDIGLTETMTGVLSSLGLSAPSKIQAISYNTVLTGEHCMIADQTGSGKTLAYLMPTIQRMVELIRNNTIASAQSRSPYIVIITPTTELATQVSRVVKSLSNILKFRTACVTSISDMDSEQKKLRLGSEVLVATPGRLLALINKKEIILKDLQTIIFDEADVLFMDQSFPLQPIGAACPKNSQFIFTTATLPDIVKEQITAEFPSVAYLSGPGLHRIAPTIEEILIDCSGPREQERNMETSFENKRLALVKAIEDSPNVERTIIFCNTIAQCRRVENALQRVDRQSRVRSIYAYHGAIDATTRQSNIVEFSRPLLKIPAILICTDRASRGIDFDRANVDHVILFDFPSEPSEYVRRVGRTGRAGRLGKATVLVHGKQVAIAKQVLSASIDGKRIDPVPELNNFESWQNQ